MTNPDSFAAFGGRYVRGYAGDGLDVEAFFRTSLGVAGRYFTHLHATGIQSSSGDFVPLRKMEVREDLLRVSRV
jgi:hypothetical protein